MAPEVGVGVLFDGRPGCDVAFIADAALCIEDLGFAALHVPDHVVTFDDYESIYPFSDDGRPPIRPTQAFLEPLMVLQVAATVTDRLRLGTCVDLVGQRHPLVRAKDIATLDQLSGGRFDYGVGIGWCREEVEALGLDWRRRGIRAEEHVTAMRAAWGDGPATMAGELVEFREVHSFPKPARPGGVPVLFGGTSTKAIERALRLGDGWYAWYRTGDDVHALERRFEDAANRFPPRDPFSIVVGLQVTGPDELQRGIDAAEVLGASLATVMTGLSPSNYRCRLEDIAGVVVR